MRSFDLILPDVLPRLPGVPEPTVERELLVAAQEMCRRSRCWSVWTEPVTIVQGVTEYELDVPDFGRVVMVTGATLDGRPTDVLPWQWMDRATQDHQSAEIIPNGKLQVFTSPTAKPGEMRLKVVLVPGDSAPGLADEVFDNYRSVLADGVIARCAMIPKQSWTDPALAAAHGAAFSAQISRMALREFQGHTNTMPRARVGWC
jgi:hypothetical protein